MQPTRSLSLLYRCLPGFVFPPVFTHDILLEHTLCQPVGPVNVATAKCSWLLLFTTINSLATSLIDLHFLGNDDQSRNMSPASCTPFCFRT